MIFNPKQINIRIGFGANILIYSDFSRISKQISKYIWASKFLQTNILIYLKWGNAQIQIQIVFEGHLI